MQTAGVACAPPAGENLESRGSVQTLALGHVARDAAQMTLDRGRRFALAFLGRLLVKLAFARFSQHAGLLAGAFETAQSELEGFVLANFDVWHERSTDTL